ncbi:acyltransferase family protein [Prosthecobacter sp.]|uniref:acyltransferase family protein n=1 Tax=Prosthecobacter sp. TaxID=1965333 RepID=UPI0037847448
MFRQFWAARREKMFERPRNEFVGSNYIPSLDGWRALCIILVLGSHAVRVAGFPAEWKDAVTLVFDGNLGVRCFFIISGFLITTLLLREFHATGAIDLRGFYLRRVLRIFPVYFAFLGVVALLEWFTVFDQPAVQWVHLLTFTTNFTARGNWPTGHTWSLACEEQFYLLWPSLMIFLRLTSWGGRVGLVVAAPILLAPLCRVATYLEVFPGNVLFGMFSLLNYQDSLAIGCLLAYFHPALSERLASAQRIHLALVAAAAILVPLWLSSTHRFGILTVPLGPTFQGLGMAALISLSARRSDFFVIRWLNWRPVIWLGILSYSLYIWQQLFCTDPALFGWQGKAPFTVNTWIGWAIVAACMSYFLLEKPLLQWRKRLHVRGAGEVGRS